MLVHQLAEKYAQAIYQVAEEKGQLEAVETQLKNVAQTVADHCEMSTFLYHPRVPTQAKKNLLKSVFGQEVSVEVLHFLLLVADKRRENLLPDIIDQFILLANEARNIIVAEVKTALPLSEAAQTALKDKLKAVVGKNILLNEHVDASLIGGLTVQIGDKLIDGSVKRQLDVLKYKLLQSQAAKIGVTN